MAAAPPGLAEETTRELLAFRLGGEEYGIDILKVQEIRGRDPITPIANLPAFILGIIDLRGIIVPIVDLRLKFGLANVDDAFTVFIILNVASRVIGIVVDGVSDVISITPPEIKPVPEFNAALDTHFLEGIASQDERMIILLDIERLVLSAELQLAGDAS